MGETGFAGAGGSRARPCGRLRHAAQASAGGNERELTQAIRQAGYDCPGIASVEVVPSPQPDSIWQGPRPEVAVCRNGKRYLVARSGRNRGSLPPVVRPLAEERKL